MSALECDLTYFRSRYSSKERVDSIVYSVVLAMTASAVFAGIAYFYYNRATPVIAKRQPQLMILLFVTVGLFISEILFFQIAPLGLCGGVAIPLVMAFLVLTNVLLVRMYLLYLSHKISSNSIDYYESNARSQDTFGLGKLAASLVKLRKRANPQNLLRAVAGKSVIEFFPALAILVMNRSALNNALICTVCGELIFDLIKYMAALAAVDGVLLCFGAFKLRNLKDSLGIKTEFKLLALLPILAAFLALVFGVFKINEAFDDDVFDTKILIVVIFPLLVCGILFLRNILIHGNYSENSVLAKSTKQSSKQSSKLSKDEENPSKVKSEVENSKSKVSYTFDEVIMDEERSKLFQEHLKSEFSVENILFWRAVKALSSLDRSNEAVIQSKCLEIFDTYCKEDAVLCVNISSDCRFDLIGVFTSEDKSKWKPEVFEEACRQIHLLMSNDSWTRFKRSPLFAKL